VARAICSLLAAPLILAAAGKSTVAVYDLEGPLSESGAAGTSFFSMDFESARPLTFFDVALSLDKAARDSEVAAIVLEADDAALTLAQTEEIRRHLLAARENGKDVRLYSDHYTNKTALLGSAASHFALMPEAGVSFTGLSAESMYFKGLLDKAGIAADVIHIGDFKSFGEEFYRTGPSEFSERQTETLIGGLFEQLVDHIADGRGIERDTVTDLIDRGHFTAAEAREAGLVDELKSRTDFNTGLRETYAEADFDRGYELPDLDGPQMKGLLDVFKLMLNSGKSAADREPYVAVVALEGAITEASIAPIRREIVALLRDEHAAALVLRVDSPGGSALASEVLWEITDQWSQAGRPFAVSMGGVAASGGYYVSAGADRIFAEAGTITGSIGVVGMKFVMADAMDKLGITTHRTQRGEHADLMSVTKPFSDEESELVRDSMREVYATFKRRIVDGRGDRLEGDLEPLAGGRVYTGGRAHGLGLVDEIGGLAEAVAWAAAEADLESPHARLRPEPKSALEGMFSTPEKDPDDELVRTTPAVRPAAATLRALVRDVGIDQLPAPARAAVRRALNRIHAVEDSAIQLLGPDLQIRW
jgi:protease-4